MSFLRRSDGDCVMVTAKFQNDQHDQVAGVVHNKERRAKEMNRYG